MENEKKNSHCSPENGSHRKPINDVMERWKDTRLMPVISPVLNFIGDYPRSSLFLTLVATVSAVPCICFSLFILSALVFTVFGCLILFGSLSSVALAAISVFIFFALVLALVATGVIVLLYGAYTQIQSWIVELKCYLCHQGKQDIQKEKSK